MMKHEFEAIAGYEVSTEDYDNVIEPMYMAVCDSIDSKADFVKMIDRTRFDHKGNAEKITKKNISEMKKLAKYIYENVNRTGAFEEKATFEKLAMEVAEINGWKCFFKREMKWSCFYFEAVEYTDDFYNTTKMVEFKVA